MESRVGGGEMSQTPLVLLLLFFLSVWACEKVDVETAEDVNPQPVPIVMQEDRFSKVDSTEWVYQIPAQPTMTCTGIEAVKCRAQQMALLAWKPRGGDVPSRYGVYASGHTYTGIPYSLAIKTDTHVGTQTSLYTFATAVDNPFSVLYTEDLRLTPYNGFDCAPYYGSSCSNSVMYALGIEPPYYTYMIPGIKGMKKPLSQSPEDVEPCDLLLKSGHVVMVYDVIRGDNGKLLKVKIFETSSDHGRDTWFRDFSPEEFETWRENGKYVRYQYAYISDVTYSPSPFVPLAGEKPLNNYRPLEVCTTLGDGVTFWKGQPVKINVLGKGYTTIAVFKDEELYKELPVDSSIVLLSELPCGQYKVRLSDKDGFFGSHFTRFEVIDGEVSGSKGTTLRILFTGSGAEPRYVCICHGNHNPYSYFRCSDEDRERGYYEMSALNGKRSTHFKVYFKGRYSIISTELKTF